ncbi:PREDICTED: protein NipSnap homolog 3B isoform X1 [Cercocebus atys]|uniref:protein NipSnap homolog 3B isoform X1 n=1 Tax=Cercocebus atys TaxID=9531 RepID=UPI0005F4B3A0|nr:PREDICTED: protein NipSnap homolog 3B isoform X1 [Cercocebus atys]
MHTLHTSPSFSRGNTRTNPAHLRIYTTVHWSERGQSPERWSRNDPSLQLILMSPLTSGARTFQETKRHPGSAPKRKTPSYWTCRASSAGVELTQPSPAPACVRQWSRSRFFPLGKSSEKSHKGFGWLLFSAPKPRHASPQKRPDQGACLTDTGASGPRQYDGTFYEFRTYYLKPSKMNAFMENLKKTIHLRTAHSELVGFWSVEFGGRMNKVFHIWKYDNFAHRAEVRKALANCKEWQEQSIIPNLAHIDKQETEITYLIPWSKLEKPPKEGVYELAVFQMKPGGPALWGDAFKRAINAHVNLGYTKVVGVFHTEYGELNRVHVLWWNESADSRAAGRHKSHEDPRVVAAVRESVNYLVSQQNMLLIPTSFSPLK